MANAAQNKVSLLIVAQDQFTAVLIEDTLNNYTLTVKKTFKGKEALTYSLNNRVDLLITGLLLPDMPGKDLIAEIREHAGRPGPEIIVFTSAPEMLSEEDKKKYRILNVLEKPLDDISVFEEMVKGITER